jgi:hypothetical protein
MNGEKIFSPNLKFAVLCAALVGLIVSVSTFALAAYLFLSLVLLGMPAVTIGIVLTSWLAANVYAVVLIVKAWRAKQMTEVVRNRAIGAALLVAPAAIFGVFTLSIVSFAAAR